MIDDGPTKPTDLPPGPNPARARPEGMDEARWIDVLKKASIKQLDNVHFAWLKQRPDLLTSTEQFLWYAPFDLLEDERNDKQRRQGWKDLPPARRAEMLQLEADERAARRRGDATQGFCVNMSLAQSGEFDLRIRARRFPWVAVWHVIRASWKTPTLLLTAGAMVWHWVAAHWHGWHR